MVLWRTNEIAIFQNNIGIILFTGEFCKKCSVTLKFFAHFLWKNPCFPLVPGLVVGTWLESRWLISYLFPAQSTKCTVQRLLSPFLFVMHTISRSEGLTATFLGSYSLHMVVSEIFIHQSLPFLLAKERQRSLSLKTLHQRIIILTYLK